MCGHLGARTHKTARANDPKVVFLLFTSGNLVITGAKKEEEVHRAVAILKKTLEEKELIRYAKQ